MLSNGLSISFDGTEVKEYKPLADSCSIAEFDSNSILNITPESINAKRTSLSGNYYTEGLHSHYFALSDNFPNHSSGIYIPLFKCTSSNAGKMDVCFELFSRE